MGKGNEYTLKEAIEAMLHAYKLDGKLSEVKLIGTWEKVMGPAIQKYTRKIFIRNRVLYVELASAVLREELSYGKSKIVQSLNEECGGQIIDDIVLT
ncbi:MAG: hypothetical protein FD123_1801 [Bacteroidetes bacterium]|nr:MAG: hypothetical protein FD123_1801 [Bacteroidota bacterium]